MPLVQVSIVAGRSDAEKLALIRAVTDAVERTLRAPRQGIQVVVHEVPAAQWGIGGTPLAVPDPGGSAPP